MVREFTYLGNTFRATVHGKPGKEEIFLVFMLEDDEEGPEISLDRFEDAGNDPLQSLDGALAALAQQLMTEQNLAPLAPDTGFAWVEERSNVRVHNGVQDHRASV